MRRLAYPVVLACLAGAAMAGPTTPAPPAAKTAPPAVSVPPGMTPMSPAEFEAYATGKTLAYAEAGKIWGRETYLPGRRVMWLAVGKDCKLGVWRPENGAVCFDYFDGKASQCWAFAKGPAGMTATWLGEPPAPPATVTEEKGPVPCPGPAIGS